LHLAGPPNLGHGGYSEILRDGAFAAGSVLLLIGMAHMETFFSARDQSQSHEENLRCRWEYVAKREISELSKANENLLKQIAHFEEAGKALQETEARYRFLFAENPQPMWIVELGSLQLLAANKVALRQYGFSEEEFLKLKCEDILPVETVEAFLRDMARPCAGVESRGVWVHCKKDKTVMDVEITALDFQYAGSRARLILTHDLGQRHRHELEERRIEKLELAGQVAGSAAQHFDGLLAIIEENATQLLSKAQDASFVEQLKKISLAATRGTNLTHQLQAVGGRQLMQLKPVDLNVLIRSLNPILRRLAGEQIDFQNNCGVGQLPVLADARVLEGIIINLVSNARQAMAAGGTLTVNTSLVWLADPRGAQKETREFVRLSIRDTGCGLSSEAQAKLFEPFFSTRSKGMGLGLASVYGAVKQHWGWIEFATAEKAGTEFKIFFPRAPLSAFHSVAELQTTKLATRGTVLLVESDARSRGMARHVLNRHGFRVIEADCASIACTLWEGESQNIDLLITGSAFTDGKSAVELANQLREQKPDLKIIYVADEDVKAAKERFPLLDGSKLISKPYNPAKLLQSVEDFFCYNS
jgi:nitrogen-specific signal transduction histidine kinase/CheY-like chemotaxis protein